MHAETIAAISTPVGRGGVAVVRVSGDGAFGLCKALTGRDAKPGRIMVRNVLGEECVVLAFKAPHSYTGEDVVEFQCHGGLVAPRRILDATLRCGARLAGRGEFTRRAFLNGRIGWEEAQAVLDLIDAKTDEAAQAALSGLAGEATRHLRKCYDEALEISSIVEHSLDIDEGELPGGFAEGVKNRVAALLDSLRVAVRKLRERSLMRNGAVVVLAGEPNAGKSSLFNALVRENRAIVSATAGTTRDAIEAWLDIGGWPVRLVDTAGLRTSTDEIEAEGVRRSVEYIAKADVVCRLIAPDTPSTCAPHPSKYTLEIHTKADIARADGLCASAKTGEGLDDVRNAIATMLERIAGEKGLGMEDGGEDAIAAIHEAEAALANAISAADDLVIAGNAIRSAAQHLGRYIGAEYSQDMLDRLFSRFCVGK